MSFVGALELAAGEKLPYDSRTKASSAQATCEYAAAVGTRSYVVVGSSKLPISNNKANQSSEVGV